MNQLISDKVKNWIEQVRQTEQTQVLWCITAYNESGEALLSSLAGVKQNLDYLVSAGNKSLAQQITLCLIFDGQEKMSTSVCQLLERLDLCYTSEIDSSQEANLFKSYLKLAEIEQLINLKIISDLENNQVLNVYRTVQEDNPKLKEVESLDSVRVLICIKGKNRGKLDSHWWLFQVFCHYLQPVYCIQMDIGSVPKASNLHNLWEFMETSPDIGGAEGMILTPDSYHLWDLITLWQSAGFYRESVFNKPMEIMTGYLSILPGQFSLLRWKALAINEKQKYQDSQHLTPLENYFQGLDDCGIFKSNAFLTEDRILGFGIITSLDHSWKLAHLPSVITMTENCQSLSELLKQRRRWFNGAFACNLWILRQTPKYLLNKYAKWIGKFHLVRSLPLSFLRLFYNWFGLAGLIILYYEMSRYIQDLLSETDNFLWISVLITSIGVFLIFIYLIESLCDNITHSIWFANLIYFMLLFLTLMMVTLYTNHYFLCFMMVLIVVITWLVAKVYSPWLANRMRKQLLIYFLIEIPISALLNIYAFCNIDNCSWGTKGLNGGKRNYLYRTIFVVFWLISNSLLLFYAFQLKFYKTIIWCGFLEYAIALICGIFMVFGHLLKKRLSH